MQVKNVVNKYFGRALGCSMLCMCAWGLTKSNMIARKEIENYKSDIKAMDSLKYNDLYKNSSTRTTTGLEYWKNAHDDIQDSLKYESAIQKSYFEGAQMVRDSIKFQNK